MERCPGPAASARTPGRGSIRSTRHVAAALLFSLASISSAADEVGRDDFAIHLALASDYVFRGTSQTREDPALQLGIDFEHESGLFAGVWGSNVDFPPLGPFEDPRDIELQIYAGYGLDLGNGFALAASLHRYEYPGADGPIDWDYNEIAVALHSGRAALSFAYSDSALGSSEEGLAIDLTDSWSLGQRLDLSAGVGYYDLDAPFLKDYLYWGAQIARGWPRLTLSLGYFDSDSRGEDLWGERAAARLVASVSYRIL